MRSALPFSAQFNSTDRIAYHYTAFLNVDKRVFHSNFQLPLPTGPRKNERASKRTTFLRTNEKSLKMIFPSPRFSVCLPCQELLEREIKLKETFLRFNFEGKRLKRERKRRRCGADEIVIVRRSMIYFDRVVPSFQVENKTFFRFYV